MVKVLLVLVSTFLVSATVALPVQEELDWWQKTVIYQIYPRSYRDSDGNGVGDLRGIWQRVKPIKDAGAGAVWLSPIYESPMKDFGYDITNHTVIDPLFGNMEDFMDLMDITHELGLKLILDFVPDYSSDQHEWFQKSVKRIDPYTDYYIWHDGKVDNETGERSVPNNWVSAFEGSAWSWNEDRQQYYYHVFTVEQPDLNYRNEFLVEDMKSVMRYWLDMGVDGFRVDSVPHLFEDTEFLDEPLSHDPNALEGDYDSLVHIYTQNLPETYDMIYQFRAVVDEYKAKDGVTRVMMTEAYETINQTMLYYGTDERPGAHFTFNFLFIRNLTENSTADDYDYIIHQWMDNMPEGRWANWVVGNHDNHRAASRFPHLADAINMIAQLLPGTAVTYMGEEIAMEDTFISWEQTVDPPGLNAGPERYQLFSRDPERTPYQWDNTTSAGFSTNATTWLPVNPNYLTLNLAAQVNADESESHYKVYQRLTGLRQTNTIQRGSLDTQVISELIFSFSRALEGEDTYIVLVNLGDDEALVDLSQFYSNLPPALSVAVASVESGYDFRDEVSSNEVTISGKSGLVLST